MLCLGLSRRAPHGTAEAREKFRSWMMIALMYVAALLDEPQFLTWRVGFVAQPV